jgi:hypothetical protein
MVGRTVVIGDIPWVAQAAEAFLSKVNLLFITVDDMLLSSLTFERFYRYSPVLIRSRVYLLLVATRLITWFIDILTESQGGRCSFVVAQTAVYRHFPQRKERSV